MVYVKCTNLNVLHVWFRAIITDADYALNTNTWCAMGHIYFEILRHLQEGEEGKNNPPSTQMHVGFFQLHVQCVLPTSCNNLTNIVIIATTIHHSTCNTLDSSATICHPLYICNVHSRPVHAMLQTYRPLVLDTCL